MSNHYAVLGVLPTASADEVKASYRQLVKRFHPDVSGGSARFFARIQEAYEVLGDATQRRAFDAQWKLTGAARARAATRQAGGEGAMPNGGARADGGADRGARAPMPILTRIMSITVARTGRFQLQGLIGDMQIIATTPDNLWDTTLRKYGSTDRERLARHVIQIKLSGERELVRSLMPRPTDFGVEFERGTPEEKQRRLRTFLENVMGRNPFAGLFSGRGYGMYGAHLPLTLQVTVPKGTPLFLRDVTGAISVGHVEGAVVAKLLGGVLRTGRISRAHLTLNGGSTAFLSDVQGEVDLMGFGTSKTYLGGRISRLRAVLENQARAEVSGTVDTLLAEVNGQARLDLKQAVREAHCDVADSAHIRLARVHRLSGTRADAGRVEAYRDRPRVSMAG